MEEKQTPRPCPQDCRKCCFQQHAYCAAQMSYTLSASVAALMERMEKLESALNVDAAGLSNPIAQEGSGAATIGSQNNNS